MVNWRDKTMNHVKNNSKKVKNKKNILYFRLFKNTLQVAGKGTYNNFYIGQILIGKILPFLGHNISTARQMSRTKNQFFHRYMSNI